MNDPFSGVVYAMELEDEKRPDKSTMPNPPSKDGSGIEPSTLQSAACYVAGSAGTGCQGDGSGETFSSSFKSLMQWGEANDLIKTKSEFPFFGRPPDGSGDEHEAWFYEPLNRWFKATYPNQFGIAWGRIGSATAREYLNRLVLQNKFFGDDIQLIALVNCEGRLRVLTLQPHISGTPASCEEIWAWFTSLGFSKLEADGSVAWYSKADNLLVADAHEGNVLKTAEGILVPIDLNIIQPTGELLNWAANYTPV